MPTLVEQLAAFAHGIAFERMPPEDVAAIRRLVLDTLGCALGAVDCHPAELLRPLLVPQAREGNGATGWGTAQRYELPSAILANGTLVRYLDFMDVYWAREICHPSENIPVALALAEDARCSGRALVEAIAIAYEVQVRLADAFAFESQGLHHVSAAGFVAPLVMARLWGLPPAQAAQACALGGFRHLTHAALVRGELSMAKAVGYAVAASECVGSTRLAAAGFTGPLRVLEELGVQGLDWSPGTGCARRVSLKQFPVQYTLQAPVEAALALREQLGGAGGVQALREVCIEVQADVCRRTADPAKFAPASRETADHSLPCCVALALADGALEKRQFDGGRWAQEDIRALMARIRVEPSAELEQRWPGGRPVRLTATLHDGGTREVLVPVPLGDASRPMTDAALEAKFLRQAVPVLGAQRAAQLLQAVQRLDALDDAGVLGRLCATGVAGA